MTSTTGRVAAISDWHYSKKPRNQTPNPQSLNAHEWPMNIERSAVNPTLPDHSETPRPKPCAQRERVEVEKGCEAHPKVKAGDMKEQVHSERFINL